MPQAVTLHTEHLYWGVRTENKILLPLTYSVLWSLKGVSAKTALSSPIVTHRTVMITLGTLHKALYNYHYRVLTHFDRY